jgi:hypothetical protein
MRQLTVLLFVALGLSYGQSAYQRMGYGELFPTRDAFSASVGAGVIVYKDSARASYWNPASLNNMKRVYFGATMGSDFLSVDGAVVNDTRFNQVVIALPLGQRMGMSLQMNPVADFESQYTATLDFGSLSELSSGGIWDYAMGLGAEITPTLQLGIKYHLLHGLLRREMKLSSDDLNEAYVIKGGIDGSSLELGAITTFGDKVRLGVTADLILDNPVFTGEDSLGGSEQHVALEEALDAWPTTIRLGIQYTQSKRTSYLLGVSQQIFPAGGLMESSLFSLPAGWELVPVGSLQLSMLRSASDRNSRTWFKRVGWRTGFGFKNHYLARGTSNMIYEMSWNSGVSLALRNGRSIYNISTEIGSRTGEDTLPAEMFARVKLGIQVNDIWFKKIKRR